MNLNSFDILDHLIVRIGEVFLQTTKAIGALLPSLRLIMIVLYGEML